jgi:hypothetical protein
MSKTLVIILSETRAHELTFDNFKKNVIDELGADLCICIGANADYDTTNPYYKLAKHRFIYNEPDDFGDAFDYAYDILSKGRPKYEKLENTNLQSGKLPHPQQDSPDVQYYGANIDINKIKTTAKEEIVVYEKTFPNVAWRNKVFGIKNSDPYNCEPQNGVTSYKRPLHWREFLKIKSHFLGGIKDAHNQHPGSAGILIFFRWFLLKNLLETNVINAYDRFIITRSDFIYQLPHPKMELMNKDFIWIPDGEQYGGFTGRHVVLSKKNIVQYLNILNNMVLKSNEYFTGMKSHYHWNIEQLISFHLEKNNVIKQVKLFPYIMYSVRNKNGKTRWQPGVYSDELGYYIKYTMEHSKSSDYKKMFETSNTTLNMFYLSLLNADTKA